MLTHKQVSELLEYNQETGVLKWTNLVNKRYAGKVAGNVSKNGYIELSCKNYRLYGHRVAWLLVHKEWPNGHVDHINGNRADNRIENLRVVNNMENHHNMKRHKKNSSGVTGVYWSKRAKKWQAYICVDGKQKYLGVFKYLCDAEQARKDADEEYAFHKNHGRP